MEIGFGNKEQIQFNSEYITNQRREQDTQASFQVVLYYNLNEVKSKI
jgi:hypothetical protein